MKMYYKGFLFSFAFVLFIGFSLLWANQEGYFNLQKLDIKFEADYNLRESGIMQLYKASILQNLSPINGKSLFSISASKINQNLMQHEWVKQVKIRRVFPDKLRINITPKTWLAYVYKKNKFYPFSSDGDVLDAIPVLQGPDLPIIRIKEADLIKYKKIIVSVLNKTQSTKILMAKLLQEIGSDGEGLYFTVAPGGVKIRLGLEDIDLRIGRVEKVMSYLKEQQLQGRVINADFSQKVVVKLRKAR